MPCLKCQYLLLKTEMKSRMKIIECTVYYFVRCRQGLHNPITEEKGPVSHSDVPLFWQTTVSLAHQLPKVNMPSMYSFVYIVYLKIMLITYINLSDLRTIIQSATLLMHKFKGKVSYGIGTNCLAFKT